MSKNEEYKEENEFGEFEEEFEELGDEELTEKAKIKRYGSITLGVVAAIVAIFIGFNYWQESQEAKVEEANMKLQKVLPSLAQGNYEMALEGGTDPNTGIQIDGLKQIANTYSSIEIGKTASFYAGKALLESGDSQSAINYFQDAIGSSSDIIKVGAYAGIAKAYELEENWASAAENYEKAGASLNYTVKKSKYFCFAGMAYEKAGNNQKSEEVYRKVLEINVKNTGDEYSNLARAGLYRLGTEFEL